jgi:cytochrome c-type biogenesis protein CcmH
VTAFLLIAAAFALAMVVWVAWPLWRGARLVAVLTAAAIVAGTGALYAHWSNWTWDETFRVADTPAAVASRLARRLQDEPEDREGWLMLGQSYTVLQQYPLAVRAFQRAYRLADGRDADALTGWAEALTLIDENELAGRAGRLFEEALVLEPQNGKALFFAGIAAERRGELPLARERFVALLALGPPDTVRGILQQQVQALDAAIASAGTTAAPPAAATAAPPADGAAGASASIDLQIRLAPQLAARVPAGTSLFVAVRRPGEPGPPLAAQRLAAQFPLQVRLTPADAMMPGRTFAAGETVEVVARVSLGGTPTASPGDPFGELRYDVGRDAAKVLVIDQLTP